MKKVFPGSKIRLKIDDSEGVYVFSEKVSVKEGLDVVPPASPVGKAILGKSEGETVLVKGAVEPISVKIQKILKNENLITARY